MARRRFPELQLTRIYDPNGDSSGAEAGSRSDEGFVRALLRFPLFYKILVANLAIVMLVAFGSAALTRSSAPASGRDFALLLLGGLLVSALSNAVILRLALSPLARLQRAAERVQAGDLTARVEASRLADPRFEQLTQTFNSMLDSAEAYRRRLREIAARALNATEEERKRIARELHDGTAQTLAALRLRLRLARGVPEEEGRSTVLDRIAADIGEVTEEIRRIAQGLRPPALDMLGLAPAIESYARVIAETTGIVIDTDFGAVDRLLTPEAELALYRIIQEALSNVARHSAARRAWIRMRVAGRQVVTVIEDDGRGFAIAADHAGGALGLFGMQERAGYVGGALDVDSEPGAGTRVRVTIPVAEAAQYA
jgi:two-component system, NarL family, sensor histidine kinase UhpB